MRTLQHLIDSHGVDVLDHLDRQAEIPILTGMQRQGDVLIVPTTARAATTPVPAAGVPVVRGENGGNTHTIVAAPGDATCDLRTASTRDLTLAVLTVTGVAWLAHPEHGYTGIGAGTYRLTRQREQADELRLIAD